MDIYEEMNQTYEDYLTFTVKLAQNAKPTDGLFGFGNSMKTNPGHEDFYDKIGELTEKLLENAGNEELIFHSVSLILHEAYDHRDNDLAYWFLYAAHGHCKKLIPHLSPSHCRELLNYYDAAYPKVDRMPVQQQVYKLLKKYSRK